MQEKETEFNSFKVFGGFVGLAKWQVQEQLDPGVQRCHQGATFFLLHSDRLYFAGSPRATSPGPPAEEPFLAGATVDLEAGSLGPGEPGLGNLPAPKLALCPGLALV